MNKCECGCGQQVKSGNRFVHGHNWKNKKRRLLSEETKKKMYTKERNKKISKSRTGMKFSTRNSRTVL
ncbi:MAG: hypothetical protein HQ538_06435 [Parcubacteria group bacterium]|nr:hypothetical protein [Parcubacteria group bacterium]